MVIMNCLAIFTALLPDAIRSGLLSLSNIRKPEHGTRTCRGSLRHVISWIVGFWRWQVFNFIALKKSNRVLYVFPVIRVTVVNPVAEPPRHRNTTEEEQNLKWWS